MQAAAGGTLGLLLAIGAWVASIPVLTWILVVIGGFLAVMAVLTLVALARQGLRVRR